MSAPPAKAAQPSTRRHPARRHPPGQGGKRNPRKLAGPLALIASALAALLIGIGIGNAARKRIDKWSHAWSSLLSLKPDAAVPKR